MKTSSNAKTQIKNLSLRDLKVLQDLSEDYLCLTCTHVGGIFDFENALQRLESAATVENIFLQSTPVNQTRVVELQFGTWALDTVAENILKKAGKFIASVLCKNTNNLLHALTIYVFKKVQVKIYPPL